MKKRRGIIVLSIILAGMTAISGCQKTPEKSSVVSKAGGLSEDVIAEPLKEGDTKKVDLPDHWKVSEKRGNDRAILTADVYLDPITVGNLPVVEMENHAMTDEELGKLVKYFAGDEELYVPQLNTRDIYQGIKNRIDNKEGGFADTILWPNFQKMAEGLEKAIELAPEKEQEPKEAEVKFQKKQEDKAKDAAQSWYESDETDTTVKDSMELYFSAEAGEDRQIYVKAERYDPDAGNSSRFSWRKGMRPVYLGDVESSERLNGIGQDFTGYGEAFQKILDQFTSVMEQPPFTLEEGQKQAEQLLDELDIQNMSLSSTDKLLWYPKGIIADDELGHFEDQLWQLNPQEGKAGYEYIFVPAVGGILVDQFAQSVVMEQSESSYTPPFPVEQISIAVTEDGVVSFTWTGICSEVSTVAENTNLIPFEEIQDRLFDQMFYWYTMKGQPAESKTKFTYNVYDARLRYTYITAYGQPDHAWLVPAWLFEVMEGEDNREEMGELGNQKDMQILPFTINALDGGMIGETIQ